MTSATMPGWAGEHDDDEIVPRDIRFNISGNPERHWFDGDPMRTAMFDAFSIFLPEGERFFIRSLKHYASTLGDPELIKEINGYAVQEAFHTREHEDYNRTLAGLGYDVEAMEQPVKSVLGSVKVPLLRLAVTCAVEHLTANFSTMTLRHQKILSNAHPAYRRLWMWHALEELEHKAVALDVYKRAAAGMPAWKRYGLRVSAMNLTAVHFVRIFLRNVRLHAQADGIRTGFRFWSRFAWLQMVSPGYIRVSLWSFLCYYLPGYDPRKVDDSDLIRKGRAWLANEYAADGAAQETPAR
ncbi:metal-dependent hydrolase [Stappia indica]|uniref:metal-dependent hydrolase n=1 Tax=Stappia indica TaxID=538381 RepID=UPI001D17FF19|nr:metal-dependent hydrolase [Stappia indica]MCC4242808.1 metal-dependent hydrolase [Stappia indica]